MFNYKFELRDKVLIKSLNKEGIVVGRRYDQYEGVSYEVKYDIGPRPLDCGFGVMEYLVKSYGTARVVSSEISNISDKEIPITTLNDWMDTMCYSMFHLYPNTSWEEWVYTDTGIQDFSMDTISPKLERKKVCSHSWKTYEGFTQKYDYCVHCDEKKMRKSRPPISRK